MNELIVKDVKIENIFYDDKIFKTIKSNCF